MCSIKNLHIELGGGGLATKSGLTLATPWTVAQQAPLSTEISQAGVLQWVAISFSIICGVQQCSFIYRTVRCIPGAYLSYSWRSAPASYLRPGMTLLPTLCASSLTPTYFVTGSLCLLSSIACSTHSLTAPLQPPPVCSPYL